jgi:Flp pilus assembly pilin Flp
MKELTKRFVRDERGLELAEYAVMAALVIAVVVAAIVALRSAIGNRFNATATQVNRTS